MLPLSQTQGQAPAKLITLNHSTIHLISIHLLTKQAKGASPPAEQGGVAPPEEESEALSHKTEQFELINKMNP
jgi:hypothetical protein